MSQLTSIEQCKVGMIVCHSYYGKGRIYEVNVYTVSVQYKNNFFVYVDDAYDKEWNLLNSNLISHLFTTPVFICERIINGHDTEIRYKPVKPETK